jgi:hypothetical protein
MIYHESGWLEPVAFDFDSYARDREFFQETVMTNRLTRLALVLGALAALATPAAAQGIVIGRDGIRVEEPRDNSRSRDDVIIERRDGRRDDNRRGPDRREVSEREAIRIAKGEGLRNVEDVDRTRSTYRLDGTDRRGRDITVVVDRRSGEVISVN